MDFDKLRRISWYPGHMRKALREIREKLQQVDLVVEVLDARCPLTTRNSHFDDILQHKARALVLLKADLAESETTNAWVRYLRTQDWPCVATERQARNLTPKVKQLLVRTAADERRRRGSKYHIPRALRAMVLGYPNVGKSSLINVLAGRKQAHTGPRPGVTTSQQWIRLGDDLELLDTPGIMIPRVPNIEAGLKLGLVAAVKDELVGEELLGEYLLHQLVAQGQDAFKRHYKLSFYPELIQDLLPELAQRRGLLQSGGEPDCYRAARLFLKDFRDGHLGRLSLERPA